MSPSLTFDSVLWMPLAVVLSAAVVACCIAAYVLMRRTPLPSGVRAVLISLRIVGLLVLTALLLRPVRLVEQTLHEKLGLVLLADASQSMTIRDGAKGATRLQAAKQVLTSNADRRALLAERYAFKELAFGKGLSDLALDRYAADEPLTAIGNALSLSLEKVTAGNIAGIVLLSDGANNCGRDPEVVARDLAARKVPIYPVVVGKKGAGKAVKDVKVVSLDMPAVAFARNSVPVAAEVRCVYCDKEEASVALLVEDKEVATQEISVRGIDTTSVVQFTFVPDAVGPQKITVSAKPRDGEIITTNNSITSYMHVLGGKLKVLYVGRSGPEFKFIRRALGTSRDIQLDSVLTLGQKIAKPSTAAEWGQYDAVIIGDATSSAFTPAQLSALESAVSRNGVGFGMLAGARSFSAGDYAGTPMAKLLPVAISNEGPEEQFETKYAFALTPAGAAHFMLRLDGDEAASKAAWAELRPLAGGIRFRGLKPAAEVLAVGPGNLPILVVGRYGRGRTMAFASDSTWRWAFAEKDTARFHRRFWRQVLLWLGNKENLGRPNVWIGLQSLRVIQGEPIRTVAHVESPTGEHIPGARIEAKIIPPKGEAVPLSFRPEDDRYICTYRPEAVGDHRIELRAFSADGSLLGEDTAKFVVYMPEVELENPSANPEALERLAAVSGGRLYAADEAPALFKDLAERDSTIEIKRTEPQPLWNSRWILYVFLIALGLEWTLRKIYRLI